MLGKCQKKEKIHSVGIVDKATNCLVDSNIINECEFPRNQIDRREFIFVYQLISKKFSEYKKNK